MNVFAILSNPSKPIKLTLTEYEKQTKREYPYCQKKDNDIKSYALCPDCNNPIQLVNRYSKTTKSNTLYARHVLGSVAGIANYSQTNYDNCELKNPTRFDEKIRRKPGKKTNSLKLMFEQHIDLIISQLEKQLPIKLSDNTIKSMIADFIKNKGYEYRAVNVYNMPLAFAYLTEAQDLYGCFIKNPTMAAGIKMHSQAFETSITKYKNFVIKRVKPAFKLRFFFSNHQIPTNNNTVSEEQITLNIIEYDESIDNSRTLYTQNISIDKTMFFNTLQKRYRLQQWIRDSN
ncbi:TPA: hypothetical protein ACVU5C_004781 [Vibrio parahaemolyticus]|nr:hypothetical protein [Vibrio parahaemolyticus]